MYDKVLLKNGDKGTVVDFIGDSAVIDIDMEHDCDTQLIDKNLIEKVIEK